MQTKIKKGDIVYFIHDVNNAGHVRISEMIVRSWGAKQAIVQRVGDPEYLYQTLYTPFKGKLLVQRPWDAIPIAQGIDDAIAIAEKMSAHVAETRSSYLENVVKNSLVEWIALDAKKSLKSVESRIEIL